MNTSLLAKIGEYILAKNAIKRRRNIHRSRANYYEAIYRNIGQLHSKMFSPRGLKKWNKPGSKQHLRILIKENRIKQMEAEIEMHEMVISMRKTLNDIRKQMPFTLGLDTDYLRGVYIKGDKYISSKDLLDIVNNENIEKIILGKEA